MGEFSVLETMYLLYLADTWLFQLIVDAFSSRIEVEKAAESLRKSTFLEKRGSELILFFLLFPKENKATASEKTFLGTEEAETLLKEHLAIK